METKILIAQSLQDLPQIAQEVISFGKNYKIWLFEGEMGAGKTTLIKAICKELGVSGHVQSPTFALINEYVTDSGEEIYHFDFYRIKNEDEAMDIGVEDYLFSGERCFIEWASKIENLLPTKYLKIEIQVQDDGGRIVNLSL